MDLGAPNDPLTVLTAVDDPLLDSFSLSKSPIPGRSPRKNSTKCSTFSSRTDDGQSTDERQVATKTSGRVVSHTSERFRRSPKRAWSRGCTCPHTCSTSCSQSLTSCMSILKTIRHVGWICCLPPLPCFCLSRMGFWPHPSQYYFIREETTSDGTSSTVKMHKAGKDALGHTWQMGFVHKCKATLSKEYGECFVVMTKQRHNIWKLEQLVPERMDLSDYVLTSPSLAEIAESLNVDILIYDYSGYGASSGLASETSLFADVEAVYQHLTTVRKVDPQKIVVYGHSIGTAAAISLMSEMKPPVAGLILLAPLASMLRVLLWKRACFNKPFERRKPCVDKHSNLEKITSVTVPVLICHGVDDELVPVEHGEAIWRAAPNPVTPFWIADHGHRNLEYSRLLWQRIHYFLHSELPKPEEKKSDDQRTKEDS